MDERVFWREAESLAEGATVATVTELIPRLRFNADGLLPVVVCCAEGGTVLMMAWMNETALRETLRSGRMTYFSRSRQGLWRKGETSGCEQRLRRLAVDCDGDALLASVEQVGAGACHTGRRSCFYVVFEGERAVVREG